MVLGIISIIIGAIIFIVTFLKDISTVQQQTVQYLGFIWASLFILGGFILVTIENCFNKSNQNNSDIAQANQKPIKDFSTTVSKGKSCPYCAEEIKQEATICPHCTKNIKEYEDNQIKLAEEKKAAKASGGINTLYADEGIMKQAKDIRRIYGKSPYITFLKDKAKELGLGDIELSEADIEQE